MPANQKIKIDGKEYSVLDAKEYMTIPDCFVKENKIGSGNGEAKFYVGNSNPETDSFFDRFNRPCFFLKSDLGKYLEDAKTEYQNPQQNYVDKSTLQSRWAAYGSELNGFPSEIIPFDIFKAKVAPPRVYINSSSDAYTFVRKIALPQISYFSALKIRDSAGKEYYYFKPFFDYFSSDVYESVLKKKEKEIEERPEVADPKKKQLIQAREGQGKYREQLLKECVCCPITDVTEERLLVASHIKPWIDSDDREKIDPKNGFIFTPTYDKLFDRGFISFEDDKTMRVSAWLSPLNQRRLNIRDGKKVFNLPVTGREKYLQYHRNNIFKK